MNCVHVIGWTGKNIDGSTVEVCLAKPVEKGSMVRWTRSPASGKLSPAVCCPAVHAVLKPKCRAVQFNKKKSASQFKRCFRTVIFNE